jgi:pyridoxal phosphate enzyme (YggS family)
MVAEELTAVYRRMDEAAARSGRDPASVTLVAVSKGQPVEVILEAYAHGHRDFGENRAAELAEKAPLLPDDIRWHFIGSLQTRQTNLARPHTHLLHSLDRPRLINRWADPVDSPPALLQVNIAEEPQKHGAPVAQVGELLRQAEERGIDCRGLMCIPPLVRDGEENRRWFVALRTLRDQFLPEHPRLIELSMGMTDDFEVAIEESATLIRVGRAIFGAPGQYKDL